LDSKIKLANILATLEDGGQATVNELKELNVRTTKESHHIFFSNLLTRGQGKKYFDLLFEYKYVLAWSYQTMPMLDPNVVENLLSIRKDV